MRDGGTGRDGTGRPGGGGAGACPQGGPRRTPHPPLPVAPRWTALEPLQTWRDRGGMGRPQHPRPRRLRPSGPGGGNGRGAGPGPGWNSPASGWRWRGVPESPGLGTRCRPDVELLAPWGAGDPPGIPGIPKAGDAGGLPGSWGTAGLGLRSPWGPECAMGSPDGGT